MVLYPGALSTGRGYVHQNSDIPIEKAEFIRALTPAQLVQVRRRLGDKQFERHGILFFEGQRADALWVLRRGQVRLYKSSRDGRIATLDTLGPGEVFGAVSALEEEVYPATAEAVTDGSAWSLPRSVFLRLLREHTQLAVEVLQIVSRRLHAAHDRLQSFAYDPAPTRLARALLRAAQGQEAKVTRRALAEAAGTTVETAIRVLRRFQRDGIVRGEVGRVCVLDENSLRRVAGDSDT